MKIAIAGDVHVNKSTYSHVKDKVNSNLPFRTVDFMRSMTFIVDEVADIKPDLFVLVGDTYDDFYPTPYIGGFFSSQLRKLKENNIPTIILVGNHEVCKKNHALMPLKELNLDFAQVIDSPKLIRFKDHLLMLFPYSLEIEQDIVTARQQFLDFVDKSKQEIKETAEFKGLPVLFFGHFGVQGATLNQWAEKPSGLITEQTIKRISKKNFRGSSEENITIEELDSIGASYVFLGDYHKHQVLATKNCKSMYTGSIERTDINEMGQKKGFILFDSDMEEDKKLGKCKFIEYKNCRPFLEIRGSLNEIIDGVKMISGDQKGAIVKVKFIGNRNQEIDFHSEWEAIKGRIKEKIDPIHIISENEIVEELQEIISEVEKNIIERGHIDVNDVLNIVGEMIDELEISDEDKKEISKIAKEIHQEALIQIGK